MFVFFVLILTLVFAVYCWQKRAFSYWTNIGIPQLKPTFPLGTILLDKHFAYQIEVAYNEHKHKSQYVGMYNTFVPLLLVLDLDTIKKIMTTDYESLASHGMYYNEKDDPISAHLFSLEGQKWKTLRAKLNPVFTSAKNAQAFPLINDISRRLVETVDKKVGERGVDMTDLFERFTVDNIGAYAFGIECNSFSDPETLFKKMGMRIFVECITPVRMFSRGAYPNLSRSLGLRVLHKDIADFLMNIVHETVELRIKNNIKRNDVLDTLITLRNPEKSNSMKDSDKEGLSMNELVAQCSIFFAAGFETSASSALFTLFELSKHQEVQDKLRTHIRAVLAQHNGELTYEALKEMTYLDQCYKEGLRMHPPLAMLLRRVTKNYKLPGTNIVLPTGTDVAIPIYAIQRDPDLFPNPEQFNPDRFSPEEEAKRHFSAWLPFGEGPRHCIGRAFGVMQVKIGLAHMIGNYRFRLSAKGSQEMIYKKHSLATSPQNVYFDVEKVE